MKMNKYSKMLNRMKEEKHIIIQIQKKYLTKYNILS